MEGLRSVILSLIVSSIFLTTAASSNASTHEEKFLECLALNSDSDLQVYFPKTTSYTSILLSSIQNQRFASPATPKPRFIITPSHKCQVQASVICAKQHGLQIRVRSGGHDFEGLSYRSDVPFLMIDLANFDKIDVDIDDNSAWVQAGATLGQVYYKIAAKSSVHGFPAGICPTVGAGGHISGAGFGNLIRKYGVSADYVVDAILVNAKGEILNRETMGEDLFWAIRGGGAASFGIMLAWKIKLVPVPTIVTVSFAERTLEQGAKRLFHKWQTVASTKVPEELYTAVRVNMVNDASLRRGRTLKLTFQSIFLGDMKKLLEVMEEYFPELEVKEEECQEMSWIESVVSYGGFPPGTPVEVLLNRTVEFFKTTFKAKSDFVKNPIPERGLEGLWSRLLEEDEPEMMIGPWGGRMNEISEDEIAFPHRAGNLYLINYVTNWNKGDDEEKHISWIRDLYSYMGPYVFQRTAFFNYRDLDLGQNDNGTATFSEARGWGYKYFKNNFERLVQVKSTVDPDNFFINEQSIPSVYHLRQSQR